MQVNHERLAQARTKTTVSGQYLLAWDMVKDYMKVNAFQVDLGEYLITFDEDEGSYYIYIVKPSKQPILGGGSAKAQVRKSDLHVYDFKFSK
jgi:hypothetical protein